MRIRVRNPDSRHVPNVAVTVETKGARPGDGPVAFAQSDADPRLADPNRPVWVLDEEPKGGTSAYANTWSLGPLKAGETKTFEWKLTAVEAGDYAALLPRRARPRRQGAAGRRLQGPRHASTSRSPTSRSPRA